MTGWSAKETLKTTLTALLVIGIFMTENDPESLESNVAAWWQRLFGEAPDWLNQPFADTLIVLIGLFAITAIWAPTIYRLLRPRLQVPADDTPDLLPEPTAWRDRDYVWLYEAAYLMNSLEPPERRIHEENPAKGEAQNYKYILESAVQDESLKAEEVQYLDQDPRYRIKKRTLRAWAKRKGYELGLLADTD